MYESDETMEKLKQRLYEKLTGGKKASPGKYLCPICLKEYTPKYPSKEKAKAAEDLMGVEQHISKICSDRCWDVACKD